VHERIHKALDRYAGDIVSVDVFLRDINGPNGGEDKRVGIRLHVRHLAPVAVISTHSDLYRAIDTSVRRAARSAKRSISRFRRIRRRGLHQLVMAEG
jgi:ribosome-associated translation inhibitor RaiA